MRRARAPCERPQPAQGSLVVLSNMQWFYGATWGRTLRVCERLSPVQRRAGCAREAEVLSRQLELIEVLRRNVAHPAVSEVHVLVGEAPPVRRFLSRLPWYERHRCKLTLVDTGTRPSFVDYMRHISRALLGRTVVLTNQDVMLADGAWASLPHALPARTAFFLSRYHMRVTYDVQHSLAAGRAEGVFNGSAPTLGRTHSWSGGRGHTLDSRRVCDMTERRFAVWRRSLCSPANFGSFDAYVLRLTSPLSVRQLDLFDYPQNAWGGENLFLYLVTRALGFAAANPCVSLRAVHVHCELPTEFGVHKVGDRRLGKREIIDRARAKLRALGHTAGGGNEDVGALRLNVTELKDVPGVQLGVAQSTIPAPPHLRGLVAMAAGRGSRGWRATTVS